MSNFIEPRLCIFIPSYNARGLLQATVKRIPWTSLPPGMHYELLFIDNASTDGTPAAIATIRTRARGRWGTHACAAASDQSRLWRQRQGGV